MQPLVDALNFSDANSWRQEEVNYSADTLPCPPSLPHPCKTDFLAISSNQLCHSLNLLLPLTLRQTQLPQYVLELDSKYLIRLGRPRLLEMKAETHQSAVYCSQLFLCKGLVKKNDFTGCSHDSQDVSRQESNTYVIAIFMVLFRERQ